MSNEEKWALYEKVAEQDKSDEAVKNKLKCEAILVTDEDRNALFESFSDKENKRSMREQNYQMGGFNGKHARSKLRPYYERFYVIV